jgi:hypothetical protein
VLREELGRTDLLRTVQRHEADLGQRFERVPEGGRELLPRVDPEARDATLAAGRGMEDLLVPDRFVEQSVVQRPVLGCRDEHGREGGS